MPSTIPTIHEELGRLRQADLLCEAQRWQSVREATEVSYPRPPRKLGRRLVLAARAATHIRPFALGRTRSQA
jgi:hypothetical protein